ncbi:MAG: hypothetical protein SGI73_09630, partial [Chloroflexota bacterium]|nr:hypothetical protein [Chloroflexota bacterium]
AAFAPTPSQPYGAPANPVGFAAAMRNSAPPGGAWYQDYAAQSAPPGMPPPPPTMPEMPPSLPELPNAPPAPNYGAQAYGAQNYGSNNAYNAPVPNPNAYNPYNATQTGNQQAGYEYVAQSASASNSNNYNPQAAPPSAPTPPPARRGSAPIGFSENHPPISASVAQYFLPFTVNADQAVADWQRRTNFAGVGESGARLAYKPGLLAQTTIRFQDKRTQLYTARVFTYLVPDLDRAGIVHWDDFLIASLDTRRISGEATGAALYGDLPPGLADAKRVTALKRELGDQLYSTAKLALPYNSVLNLFGSPDADISQFRAQLQQVARERRDAEIDTVTQKYETALDKMDDNKRKKATRLQAEKQEQAERRREELFTTGEAVLGLLRGRTTYTLSRMSNAAVKRKISKGEVSVIESDLASLEGNEQKLVEEYEAAVRAVNEKWAKVATTTEEFILTPFKKDITVDLFGIGWMPYWFAEIAGQPLLLPALV